jgi:non-heme chloroperoxidase
MPLLKTTSAAPAEIYYEDFGSGDPIVLIHGWPLSSRSWEPQVAALVNAGHRVITYDRRGFGSSSQPWSGYDYDTFAADLDSLLTKLELENVTLVGFSMGGGEVARYIGTYGTVRIRAAVLASAITPYLYASDDNPDGGLDDATIQSQLDAIDNDRPAFLAEFAKNFFSAGSDLKVSQQQVEYAQDIARFASVKGTRDCMNVFARTDFRADLEKFDVPTLVIHGEFDGIVPFEVSGKRTAATIPGADLHVIKGGPHGNNVSHADEFNQALMGFLQKTATRSLATSGTTN